MSPNPPYSKWRLIIDWILETKTRRKTKHYAETAESCFLSSPPPLIHELTAHAFFCLVFFCSHHRRPALSHPSSLKKLGRAFFYFTSLVPPTSFRSRVGGGWGGGGGMDGGLDSTRLELVVSRPPFSPKYLSSTIKRQLSRGTWSWHTRRRCYGYDAFLRLSCIGHVCRLPAQVVPPRKMGMSLFAIWDVANRYGSSTRRIRLRLVIEKHGTKKKKPQRMIIYLRTPSEHPLRCHETKPFIVIDTDGSFLVRRFFFFFRLSLVSTHHLVLYWKKNAFGKREWKKKLWR